MRRFLTREQLIDIISKAEIRDTCASGDTQPLRDALTALGSDAMTELKALTWLGCGDFESWEDALAEVKDQGNQGERDVAYMAQGAPLAEHLRSGARMIGETL